MPTLRNKKTKTLKPGELVRVSPFPERRNLLKIKQPEKLSGLLLKNINYKGSANHFEVLVDQEIRVFHSFEIEMVNIESHEKMDRFNTNFKSVIKSTDPDATLALEGDAIIIGASSTSLQQELTEMLPEEFEGVPVIVVDMSSEEFES